MGTTMSDKALDEHKYTMLGKLAAGIAHDLASPTLYAAVSLDGVQAELRKLSIALVAGQLEDAQKRVDEIVRLQQDASDGLAHICELVKALRTYCDSRR